MKKHMLLLNLILQPLSLYIYYRLWQASALDTEHYISMLANIVLLLFSFAKVQKLFNSSCKNIFMSWRPYSKETKEVMSTDLYFLPLFFSVTIIIFVIIFSLKGLGY